MDKNEKLKIAVAIPCYNEEAAVGLVIDDFKTHLPEADIYVFDNNSTDKTADVAKKAGVPVIPVFRQGKGNVVRSIFDQIKADIIIMVDGDYTYFASEARQLMEPVLQGRADMVVGNRLQKADDKSLVKLHQWGNKMIVKAINFIFSTKYVDILSGYRIFSKRFINSIPVLTSGFEIETELTLQCLEHGLDIVELPISYRSRPEDSHSKLRPFRDGWRIMVTAAIVLRDHRPLRLYGLLGLFTSLIVAGFAILRLANYFGVGSLPALPNPLLSGIIITGTILSLMLFMLALTLSAVNTRLRELKQIMKRGEE